MGTRIKEVTEGPGTNRIASPGRVHNLAAHQNERHMSVRAARHRHGEDRWHHVSASRHRSKPQVRGVRPACGLLHVMRGGKHVERP